MSEKPVKPDESDCCGSGCKPCIFDVYEERLRKWEMKQENAAESKVLNQIKYMPFLVTSIQDLEEFLKTLKFQAVALKKENLNLVLIKNDEQLEYEILQEPLNIESGEYLILKGICEAETISRSYTPILNESSFKKGSFTIIISLKPNGKMSEFIKKLQVNDIVFWRGPYRELTCNFSSYKHILLFGGGTGIVPLYNIAKSIVENEDSETWVKMIVSFKNSSSIILRNEFRILRDFWNFEMNIYVTSQSEKTFRANYNERVIFGRIDEAVIEEEIRKCGDDEVFVVVCGPEGFNHFVKNCFCRLGVKDENIFIFWYLVYYFKPAFVRYC